MKEPIKKRVGERTGRLGFKVKSGKIYAIQVTTSKRDVFMTQLLLGSTPLSDVAYVLTLPDGSLRQGRTDADGRMRQDNVPPGNCALALQRETSEPPKE